MYLFTLVEIYKSCLFFQLMVENCNAVPFHKSFTNKGALLLCSNNLNVQICNNKICNDLIHVLTGVAG